MTTAVQPVCSHGLQSVSRTGWVMLVGVLWSLSITGIQLVGAALPEPVEQCGASGCTLTNTYGVWSDRSTCEAAAVVYPTTEQEIIAAVASAVKSNQKIKVSTKYGHSIPKLACPGAASGVIISSKNFTAVLNINKKKRTVTAQGGIQLRSLVDAVAAQGLALPVSPYWDGVTLAGLLSTGAHGSSLSGKGGAVHEYVIGMRFVTPATAAEGYAKVRQVGIEDEELNAAKVSLGVLGVISTVTLQLQPAFKRNVTFKFVAEDATLEDEILRIAKTQEFGDVSWYPSLRQVTYRYDQRVSENAVGDGRNNFIAFQPTPEAELTTVRATEELANDTGNRTLKCGLAQETLGVLDSVGLGYDQNGVTFTGFPVIGPQNLIMTAGGCQRIDLPNDYCSSDPRIESLFFFDAGVALPLRHLRAFLADVKLMRAAVPQSLCDLDLYSGFLIRFVKKTKAYLGTAQLEDMAMLDFEWSRGRYNGTIPRLDMDVFQELEQIAFDKYGARPHWGKNRNWVFQGVHKRYLNLSKFLAVKNKFDPKGFFSSEWSDAILGLNSQQPASYYPHCAIEGNCKCQIDEHCAPENKSFCRPGRIYPAARVCRSE